MILFLLLTSALTPTHQKSKGRILVLLNDMGFFFFFDWLALYLLIYLRFLFLDCISLKHSLGNYSTLISKQTEVN